MTALPTLEQLAALGPLTPDMPEHRTLLTYHFELKQRAEREREIAAAYSAVLARRSAVAETGPSIRLASEHPAPDHVLVFVESIPNTHMHTAELDGERVAYRLAASCSWLPAAYVDAVAPSYNVPSHSAPRWLGGTDRSTRAPEQIERIAALRAFLPLRALVVLPFGAAPSAVQVESTGFLLGFPTRPPSAKEIEEERARVALAMVRNCRSRGTLEHWSAIETEPELKRLITRALDTGRGVRGEVLL